MNEINKQYDENEPKNEKMLKAMQMRHIRQVTSITESIKLTKVVQPKQDDNLIYSRILGHKFDMPGSG